MGTDNVSAVLGAGDVSTAETFTSKPLTNGTHIFRVEADYQNVIPETQENNNEKELIF